MSHNIRELKESIPKFPNVYSNVRTRVHVTFQKYNNQIYIIE